MEEADIHVIDGTLVDSESVHSEYSGNIIDIDLVEYSVKSSDNSLLSNSDVFINTHSSINYSFPIEPDGYVDGYVDGYLE